LSKKKSTKGPSADFMEILEQQKKEMEKLAKQFFEYPKQMEKMVKPFLDYQQRSEKMAKPILEYQQKLLGEFKKFQESWVQNVLETMEKVIQQTIEEQRKLREEANKLLSDMSLPNRVTEYIQHSQKIQEKWREQLKKTTEMIESFVKKIK
jgi:ribosome-binding ATPase YchF (GTP1/OBG family)